MKLRTVAILSSLPLLLGFFTATQAAAPKAGSTCTKLNLKQVAAGYEYTCIKSGKKLVWSKGVNVSTSNTSNTSSQTSSQQSSNSSSPSNSSTVTEGILCDANGPKTGVTTAGVTMYCTLGSDGKSSWRPQTSNNSGSGSGTGGGSGSGSGGGSGSSSNSITFGANCSTSGSLTLTTSGQTLVCRSGKYAWPISTDAPTMPSGGWSSRPAWYPSLPQAISDPNAKETSCRASSVSFTSPVVPLDQLAPTIPYGAMIGDHVTPIDHAYLGLKVLSKTSVSDSDFVSVTAPADGTIVEVSTLGNSLKTLRVVIRHDCNLYTVYMVLNKISGVLASYASKLSTNEILRPMVAVKAGQEFGQQRDNPLDFNTFDGNSWLSGFVNPFAYLTGDAWKPYTTDYLQYFTPAIRSAMTDQIQRKGSTTSGKIDWDVAGTASGNWFLAGTNGYGGQLDSNILNSTSPVYGAPAGKNGYPWSHLAIAPHEVDNSKWIFSAGWFTDSNGDFKQAMMVVEGSSVAPDKLTASNGLVAYKLVTASPTEPAGTTARVDGTKAPWAVGYTLSAGQTIGVVGIQVNSDGTLSIEINTSMTSASQFTAFTSAKRTYHR